MDAIANCGESRQDIYSQQLPSSVDSIVTLAERLLEIGVESALVMDGYDDCVVGVLERFGMEPIVLYDKAKVIDKLIENGCDDYEGANEFYEYNQLGGWHGDKTPGFLIKLLDCESGVS